MISTDKELLELAAKAAGYHVEWSDTYQRFERFSDGVYQGAFAPLTDDGDALRLANQLELSVSIGGLDGRVVVSSNNFGNIYVSETYLLPGEASAAATRWAIVRAAADIGRLM